MQMLGKPWRPVILIGLVLLAYGNSVSGSFHYDDEHSIVRNASIQKLSEIPNFFVDISAFSGDEGKGMYRPLLLVTYALNYTIHELNSTGFHVVNVLLHALCSLLVWCLASSGLAPMYDREGCPQAQGHPQAAWIAAALFALHPALTEPVNYVSSRSETLMALFFLLTLYLHTRKPSNESISVGARLTLVLALLSKETAIVLLAILPLIDLWNPRERVSMRQMAVRHGPYWLIGGLYLYMLFWTDFLGSGGTEQVRDSLSQFLTQVKAPAYYLSLLALPSHLSVDHAFSVSDRVSPVVVFGLGLILTILFVSLRGRRTWPQLTFSLLVGACVLLPTSVVPLNILVNERRVYLVLAALCIASPSLLDLRLRGGTILTLVLLTLLTVQRNQVWATPLSLWQDAVSRGARSYTAIVNLGKALQEAGEVERAIAAYRRALSIDAERGDAYNNLAVVQHEAGRVAEAIHHYQSALEHSPEMEEIHHNLAVAYQESGNLQASVKSFERALELDGNNGGLWSNYGQLLLAMSDPVNAEKAYREALRLLGERPEPANGLGNALSAQGRVAEAVDAYRLALSVDATVVQKAVILANLGESLMRSRQTSAAREALSTSLELSPSAVAHDYMGRLALAQKDTLTAFTHWRASIEIDSTRWVPLTGLGEIVAARGDLAEASTLLQRAIELGAGARAQEALRRISAGSER
ncbi:MAG: tetratricopeptide repeat protein [Gemmatimonadetes bacterium]|nr:tetratricopeptide repeat protein [Gemmatimonadota bacterium]